MVIRKEIHAAHNKGKPNKLHSVEVDGVAYRSVWAAWQTLKIEGNQWRHQPFRDELKRSKSGELIYVDPFSDKTYLFRLIPYNSKL